MHYQTNLHWQLSTLTSYSGSLNIQSDVVLFKFNGTPMYLDTHLGVVLTWTDVYIDGVIHNSSGCPVGNQVVVDTWSAQCTKYGRVGHMIKHGSIRSVRNQQLEHDHQQDISSCNISASTWNINNPWTHSIFEWNYWGKVGLVHTISCTGAITSTPVFAQCVCVGISITYGVIRIAFGADGACIQ